MTITPELDITPESAGSLERFRQLFHSGRFVGLALLGGIGTTDLQTLWRTMDKIVCMAAGYQLCTPSDPMPPADRLEQAQAALDELKRLAREWYASLDAAEQQAVIDLLRAIVAWLQAMAASLSPEAQAVLSALRALLGLLLVEQTSQIPNQIIMTEAQQKEAESLLAEFKGCHERVISVLPLEPLGFVIVTETGKEFQVNGALAIPLRKLSRQGVTND